MCFGLRVVAGISPVVSSAGMQLFGFIVLVAIILATGFGAFGAAVAG
jgi:hypothetical protein